MNKQKQNCCDAFAGGKEIVFLPTSTRKLFFLASLESLLTIRMRVSHVISITSEAST
uniref:Uncharacterized protein n=1 Tax=Manihot esculenta TaxID=3983 RepID=A0A2C9W2P8_MANES